MSLAEYKDHPIFQQNPNVYHTVENAVKASTIHVYVSVIIKTILTFIFLYCFTKVIFSIKNDIAREQQKEIEEHKAEVMNCQREYESNKCATGENFHIIGLKEECSRLKSCMETHVKTTSSSEVAIKFVAKTIDSFYENLSTQTTIKIGITIAVLGFIWKLVI